MKSTVSTPRPDKTNAGEPESAARIELSLRTVSDSTDQSLQDDTVKIYLVVGKVALPLAGCTTICPATALSPPPPADPDPPILANGTVAYIGAFLRVVIDRGIFSPKSVSSLCRKIARLLRTEGQENISPHSLRNHIDNPSPKHLEQLQMSFRTNDRYIERLIQVQGI